MNITVLKVFISPVEKKSTCFSSGSPIFSPRNIFLFQEHLQTPMEWKEQVLRNAHKSILIGGNEVKKNTIYEKETILKFILIKTF